MQYKVGANVTLTSLIKAFLSTPKASGFEYLKNAAQYLEQVANLQVRNVSYG